MSSTKPPPPRLEKVADGVFAYVQKDGGWCLNNAGMLVDGDTVALVDTAATELRVGQLRSAVREVSPAEPSVVINTHHHSDHTFGNYLFAPDAVIIAQQECRSEMAEAGFGLCGLWPNVDWGNIDLALPQVTFEDRMTLFVGDLRVELFHFGPAHTINDTFVWVPDRGVLFVGDVAMAGVTPYCPMGSIEGSLRTLERLKEFAAETVICGHGAVTGPEVFDETQSYLRWVRQLAERGVGEGLSPLELARATDLGGFAELLDSERLVGNLHRAYAEQRGVLPGAPLDVKKSFDEMVEFHGRVPVCRA